MENKQIMETSLNGLSLFKAFDGFKDNLMPAAIGAVGAGVAIVAVDRALSYEFLPGPVAGSKVSLGAKLAGVHAALPGVVQVAVAVVGVPALAFAVSKYAKVSIPRGALSGATAVLALYGGLKVAKAFNLSVPGFAGFGGAALLAENVGGPFGGAALGVEEAGKFGGIGGGSGPSFTSVMGGYQ